MSLNPVMDMDYFLKHILALKILLKSSFCMIDYQYQLGKIHNSGSYKNQAFIKKSYNLEMIFASYVWVWIQHSLLLRYIATIWVHQSVPICSGFKRNKEIELNEPQLFAIAIVSVSAKLDLKQSIISTKAQDLQLG